MKWPACRSIVIHEHRFFQEDGNSVWLWDALFYTSCPLFSLMNPHEAMDVIEKISDVKETALFGNRLHVVTDSGEKVGDKILATIPDQGYDVQNIEFIVPSMEDVFVSLIENRNRAGQPQEEVQR